VTTQGGKQTTAKTLAVFIDADNLNDATALDHVLVSLRALADRMLYRRAYGRPESLKSIHAVLWKHGVRPVANLIVDKTTTDSALVIDAVEAVCTNEIDVVAICSGDADFVPLATWLREKGCRVLCYSLSNKVFANPESFYDDVVLLDVVTNEEPAASANDELLVNDGTTGSANGRVTPVAADAKGPVAGTSSVAKVSNGEGPTVKQILGILPELKSLEPLHLSRAAKKLRDAGLLGKSASSVPLFRRHPTKFELVPSRQPNTVKFLG
jgi:hypothetical protein